jgi:hypothetical protein
MRPIDLDGAEHLERYRRARGGEILDSAGVQMVARGAELVLYLG